MRLEPTPRPLLGTFFRPRLFWSLAGLLLLCLASGPISQPASPPIPFDYGFIDREMAANPANHVSLHQVSDTPLVYRAYGVWRFPYSARDIGRVALDFGNYPHVFRHVYRCDRILEPKRMLSPLGTWYLEGRAAPARVWAIGNIDSVYWTDSTRLRLVASQNEAPRLEDAWRERKVGWLNFRTHALRLTATVVAVGRDSCTVGIAAQALLKQPMPEWLMRMATDVILTQLLDDLHTEVQRRAEARKNEQPTGYRKWLRSVRDFLVPE